MVSPREKQLQTHTHTHTKGGFVATIGALVRWKLQGYTISCGLAFEAIHFHT